MAAFGWQKYLNPAIVRCPWKTLLSMNKTVFISSCYSAVCEWMKCVWLCLFLAAALLVFLFNGVSVLWMCFMNICIYFLAMAATALRAASSRSVAEVMGRPLSDRIRFASWTFVPGQGNKNKEQSETSFNGDFYSFAFFKRIITLRDVWYCICLFF